MRLPATVRVEYGGLYAEQQKSFTGLVAVFGAAILLVVVLLRYLYESWAAVLAILAAVLLSVAAVFIGLWVTGTELNISAMMGMTMIVGIVTEVAIFYFSELQDLQRREPARPLPDLLVQAGVNRMRPIAMTTIAAILTLAPLALALGQGAAMQQPLAVAIIAGLAVQMPLVLLVMPVLFSLVRGSLADESGAARVPTLA
ncbi:MAG: efflux RND transporter permease subunit, partial [Burkholderiales bacterium]|nr:efflux RND transporter permease subunit [Burkholderiales bacterium]